VTRSCPREEDLYPLTQAIAAIMAHHLGILAARWDKAAIGKLATIENPAEEPSP
jgi:hypothetical protein